MLASVFKSLNLCSGFMDFWVALQFVILFHMAFRFTSFCLKKDGCAFSIRYGKHPWTILVLRFVNF